jgi:NAD(P)-dependent dehydrogenase (short-subunit alcohol dehydrogenase family)
MNRPLEHRNAIITGANQGLGLEIARAYVRAGANVLLCARNVELLEKAREEVLPLAASGQAVLARAGDVSIPADVEGIVAAALRAFPRLHVLVNNAGIYGPMGPSEEVDWREWLRAIEINLLGSVLMCRAVIPHFRMHRYGKIVQLSGGGATNPLPRISAYAASKAAVVRFAETLAEELRPCGVDVNAVAPGALNTRMMDELLAAGPERVGSAFHDRMLKLKGEGGTPLERGAALAVFLGSAASDGVTGKLISAAWDPWETFPDHLSELRDSDVYTLRRIVPKDRGMRWGDRDD